MNILLIEIELALCVCVCPIQQNRPNKSHIWDRPRYGQEGAQIGNDTHVYIFFNLESRYQWRSRLMTRQF